MRAAVYRPAVEVEFEPDGPATALAGRGAALVERQACKFLRAVMTTRLEWLCRVAEAQFYQRFVATKLRVVRASGEPTDQHRHAAGHRQLTCDTQRQRQAALRRV